MAQYHPFHVLNASPWPIFAGFSSFVLTFGLVMYMHAFNYGEFFFKSGILCLVLTLSWWWRDVIRESTFQGYHTTAVQRGLKIGMILFITSEVMFFFGFFWGFFHASFSPTIEIGAVWPPEGITAVNAHGIPFLNTVILILSSLSLTWAHHAIIENKFKESSLALGMTILLALVFVCFQAFEYFHAQFNISDSVYGSVFYMLTGFHGFHVIIGTIFLTVCYFRLKSSHFSKSHHLGFEFAAWYWHFVDVVWIFLYFTLYIWGA